MIIASTSAKFALPEITLGLIPAAGGTQRLTKLAGKSLAMEMILTARPMSANEAMQRGVISRVVEFEQLMPDTIELAKTIAKNTSLASQVAKACVNKALTATLVDGLAFEQTAFVPLFDSPEAKQLMNAFLNKNK
jgi:enoyl-CoA hydratase